VAAPTAAVRARTPATETADWSRQEQRLFPTQAGYFGSLKFLKISQGRKRIKKENKSRKKAE
jgi:hypothetical protein